MMDEFELMDPMIADVWWWWQIKHNYMFLRLCIEIHSFANAVD